MSVKKNKQTQYALPIGIGVLALVVIYFASASPSSQAPTADAVQQQAPIASVQQEAADPAQNTETVKKNSAAPAAASPATTNSADNIALCARIAQDDAAINTKSWSALWAQMSNPPTTDVVVVSSHYVKSQNSCYVLLHNQNTVMPSQYAGRGYSTNTYWLQVASQPSAEEVALVPAGLIDATPFTKVAECDTEPAIACRYYSPKQYTNAQGTLWAQQYYDGNTAGYSPPSLSYQDFQSLVQSDMSAN